MSNRLSLLIAHPKDLIRAGLQAMLAKTGITIAGEAADPKTTLSLVKKLRPSVMLVDVEIGNVSGVACFELLASAREASPGTKLIGMSAIENPTYLALAYAAGASDFLWAGTTAKQLVTAIEQAAAGKAPAESGPFATVVSNLKVATIGNRKQMPSTGTPLTPREQQVLSHIGYGLSNEEIARSLGISVETVKEHVQNLLRKLKVPDRTAAAVLAVRAGLV